MKRWHGLITLCLLALWLPALHHCRLEQLPALGFLPCCAHENAAPHEDSDCEADCETDGCALVEEGFFKLEDAPDRLSTPDPAPLWLAPYPALALETPSKLSQTSSSPPLHSPPWQFACRAAAPVRAPTVPA